MDQYGAAPRPSHVQDMANLLLSNRGPSNIQSIGKNWVYNFIKRHNELKTRFSKKKKKKNNHQHAEPEGPNLSKDWFNHVQIIMMEYGIAYEYIYNFDETGFVMGLIATAKIVTSAETAGFPALLQLDALMLWGGLCLRALYSKESLIYRPGMEMMLCHMTGGLNSVKMDG